MRLRTVLWGCAAAAACASTSFAGVSIGVFLDGAVDSQITGIFAATRHHAIVQYALVWQYSTAASHTELMNRVDARGATPMCVWGTGGSAAGHGFDHIIGGADDAYILSVANAVKAFGKPVILAFCPEFNLDSSPYYYLADPSHRTAKYAEMWRHVHTIFTNAGATNAQWAFCPNYQGNPVTADNSYFNYYPGDAYVDWVGALGFDTNWGGGGGSAGLSFNSLFGAVLGDEASRYPRKPQIVMWFATAGNDAQKPGWIQTSYGSMSAYPNLRAAVWYNKKDGAGLDYRVWDASGVSASVTAAYRGAISPALFLTSLPPYDDIIPGGGGGGTLDITPSPSTVARGAPITINYAFAGITQRVDAYLGVVMTDGSLLVMDSSQNFQSEIVPVAANMDVSGNPSGGLAFTVPATIPAGVYTFESVWVPAGAPVTTSGMDVAPVTVR